MHNIVTALVFVKCGIKKRGDEENTAKSLKPDESQVRDAFLRKQFLQAGMGDSAVYVHDCQSTFPGSNSAQGNTGNINVVLCQNQSNPCQHPRSVDIIVNEEESLGTDLKSKGIKLDKSRC